MSDLVVKPVETRAERKQFLELPWEFYRGDENWVPPLRGNQKELAGYKAHPFHEHSTVQTFIAAQGGKAVGRVAAIDNGEHRRRYKDDLGFFGFFESINDGEVARRLFDAARDWLAARGLKRIRGPANPSMNYECGLLVDGFDSPPTFMLTYNPPWYADLIEACGFEKSHDLFCYRGDLDMLSSLDKKLEFVAEESANRFNIRLRRLDRKQFVHDVHIFLDIYNRSNSGSWGFVPMSEGEIETTAAGLRRLIVPELTSIAEVDGKPIGAVFGLLDYNPRIKQIDGRLFPFGFIRLLANRRGMKRLRLVSTNVVPEYQRWGVGLVLLRDLVAPTLDYGIETGEFSWVLESNKLSRQSLERGGAYKEKTYRMYDREV